MKKGKAGGISNVWKNLLDSIAKDNRFKKVILLDRGHSPRYDSFETVPFAPFSNDQFDEDSNQIDKLCAEKGADLFMSTYFTSPKAAYAISYLHDFIPEKMGMNLNADSWLPKMWAIARASGYIGVSDATLRDLEVLHPAYGGRKRSLVYNSISEDFKLYPQPEIEAAKAKYGIRKKFFVLLGERMNYKNAVVFFKAFAELKNKDQFQIVCIGGFERVEYILRFYVEPFKDFLRISVDDRELSMLLNHAEALVYPSVYEGFGMPILEGMSSGCPLIIAKQATACLEVAADAALAIDGHSVEEMIRALELVQQPQAKADLIKKGIRNAGRFSIEKTLEQFYHAVSDNIGDIRKSREVKGLG